MKVQTQAKHKKTGVIVEKRREQSKTYTGFHHPGGLHRLNRLLSPHRFHPRSLWHITLCVQGQRRFHHCPLHTLHCLSHHFPRLVPSPPSTACLSSPLTPPSTSFSLSATYPPLFCITNLHISINVKVPEVKQGGGAPLILNHPSRRRRYKADQFRPRSRWCPCLHVHTPSGSVPVKWGHGA